MLNDLIEKLEAETGPSRELDAEIAAGLGGGRASHHCFDRTRQSYGPGVWFTDFDNEMAVLMRHVHIAPSYTRSVDAAISLYRDKPERAPSDPKKACMEALKQWL